MGSRNNKPGRIVKGTALQPNLKNASGVWTLDEAMQAHRANAWPQPDLFQPVSNSLRVKQQNTTSPGVLTKPIVKDGNRRQFTMSMWVKLGTLTAPSGSIRTLFEGFPGTDNTYWLIYISSGNQIAIARDDNGGGSSVQWAGVLRDPAAWYHLVFTTDTQQATDTNRVKLYINSVQQTLSGTFPTQGYATNMGITRDRNNGAITNGFGAGIRIGSRWNLTFDQNFDGGYSEVNFVDGYALSPTLFGKFDTNNTWVPVPYTGTYGTNGFYLPFNNATTSQTLGYDASVNGTATYDADQDPYRGSVVLHLTGNGPAGGQNNTFADSSSNNVAVTRVGATTQGSFSPYPMQANTLYNPAIHGASGYFNGSTDWLTTPQSSNFTFDANFTIEFWVYISTNQNADLVGTANNLAYLGSGNSGWVIAYYTSGGIRFGHQASSSWSPDTTLGMTPILNSWNHIAVVRSGSTITGYLNGVAGTTPITSSATFTSNLYGVYVGAGAGNQGQKLGGYISNLRIIKGAAVYTSAFTPTNRPFGTLTNNLLTFSEDFSNSYWTIDGTGVTSAFNASIAPDGNPTATLVREGTSGSSIPRHITTNPWSTLSGTTFTYSTYVKKYGQKRNIFMLAQDSANAFYAHFDIVAGTVVQASNSGTGTYTGSGIQDVGNGWFRIWITGSITSSSIYTMTYGEAVGGTGFGGATYQGDGSSGFLVWGSQIETTSSPSNYTPTPANFSTAPSLLLNFANAAIVDSAGAQNFTTVSNATISSSSKYGSGALTFNGSSDYLQSPAVGLNAFGATDFTIEAWINFNSVANGQIVSAGTGGQTNAYYWQYYSSQLQFGVQGIGSVTVVNWTPTANIWYHVCVMRQGPNYYQFVNGQQISVATYSQSWVDGPTYIGYGGAGYFNGKMDDVRITRGVARYNFSGFTPPARALPETGGKSFITTNVNAGVVQRFTTVGSTAWTAPTDVTQVEVLVVAGGGAGAIGGGGGGGGAGGLIYNNQYSVTPGQTYTVTVGAGGSSITGGADVQGTSGSNSIFGSLIAIGGGRGAANSKNADTGGSGGGGYGPGVGQFGAGTAGQGFNGSNATSATSGTNGGGGGGAGGTGGAGSSTSGGSGGVGLQFGISGLPISYAGGGGGGSQQPGQSPGTATFGGGAGGGPAPANGTSGTANTGGGGGGAGFAGSAVTSGAGGSGVVIVRYTTAAVGNSSDATTDNLVDSPTLYGHDYGNGGEVVGNYATLNPISSPPPYGQASPTLSNGNLTYIGVSAYTNVDSTIAITSGTLFFEVTLAGTVSDASAYIIGLNSPGGYFRPIGIRGNATGNGITFITGSNFSYGLGDVIGVAFNYDTNVITYFKNGAQQCTGTTDGALNRPISAWVQSGGNASVVFHCNFGQRAWAYAPPAGFGALTTKNLPRPAVGSAAAAPNEYFDTVLYTGTGSARTVSGFNFSPDLLWIKDRSGSGFHRLFDRVRGATNSPSIYSNSTAVEAVDNLTFTSNGFSYTTDPYGGGVNTNNNLHVAWGWKAGGAAVSNTAGTITSQVSANTASGFSIATWSGNNTNSATIGHGLTTAPSMFIIKARNATANWYVWHSGLTGSTYGLSLNATDAQAIFTFGTATVGATTITAVQGVNGLANINGSATNYVGYFWSEVAGFSKFGSYTGNGSTDGVFVYTGFRPRFIMTKRTDSTGDWLMVDTARDTFNPTTKFILGNSAGAESTATIYDINSNGFKLRLTTDPNINTSTIVYMAFADKPFGNVNGTAR
jgi:hypothetical protein